MCDMADAVFSATHELPGWKCSASNTPDVSVCEWFGVSCVAGVVVSIALPSQSLSGRLPSSLGLLAALTAFDLSKNTFTGSIPSSFGYLSRLAVLKLNDNLFSGPLFDILEGTSSLSTLLLGSNFFTGSLPYALCNSPLTTLDILHNNFYCYSYCLSTITNVTLGQTNECEDPPNGTY